MPTLPLASRTLPLGLGALLLLSTTHTASVARAQECQQDSDCHAGQVCAVIDISRPDCPPGQTCAAPGEPETVQECIGQPCRSDSGCPPGMGCDISPASSPPCAAGEDCPPPAEAPTEGFCEPQEIECERNADCPEGLLCVGQQGGDSACTSSPDGGTTCEVPDEPETFQCSFVRTECETDDDCEQEGFACIEFAESESCSQDVPACDPEGNCPDASAPECDSEFTKRCFPARVDCEDDSDCAARWSCYPLGEIADSAPEEFADATDVCFPEGLVLALEEQIELGEDDSSSDNAGSGSDDRANTSGADPEAAGDEDADGGSVSATSMTGSNVVMDDDGCAVSAPGSAGHRGSSGLMLLGLLALLLRARRRG